MNILVLNSGSSSQKTCLYQIEGSLPEHPPTPAWEGKVTWEDNRAVMEVRNSAGATLKQEITVRSYADATEKLLDNLSSGSVRVATRQPEIDVVGHRIVNGGEDLKQPMFITALTAASAGRLIPVPGGVLIKDAAGETVGAVGVSGDTSDRDELCGVAGIAAAGLTAMTGAS